MAQAGTCIVRVSLLGEPSVSRDIEFDSAQSLYQMAEGIVGAFGFDFDHAFGFYSGRTARTLMSAKPKYELFADMGEGSDASSVKKSRIADAFPAVGHAMTFLFDYGDEWLFRVKVIGRGEKAAKARYPKVLAEKGAAPVQYPDPEDEEGSDEEVASWPGTRPSGKR